MSLSLFSNDLLSNAKKHLHFLREIHTYNQTMFTIETTSPTTKVEMEVLRRYRDLWLPFIAVVQKDKTTITTTTQLIPPPDIAWLWHCHRLAPQEYMKYCSSNINHHGSIIILEAHPPFTFAKEPSTSDDDDDDDDDDDFTNEKYDDDTKFAIIATQKLWNDAYPNESFFLSKEEIAIFNSTTPWSTTPKNMFYLNGYDILGSARRQMAFLWQVSGEKYTDDTFLQQGVQNYEKFLKLIPRAKEIGMILVPTYQIDLIWHTHILSSITDYNTDCINIIHCPMYHDDSLTDRSEGGILDTSFSKTQTLWKKVYDTEYIVFGGMYRGEPPSTYYYNNDNKVTTDIVGTPNDYQVLLIGKVGASSTSSNIVASSSRRPWVPLNGTASDGNPAFIRTEEQLKSLIQVLPYRENYILCRIKRITGYYHIETKEAQKVLFYRMSDRLHILGTDMMIEMCTCGLFKKSSGVEYKNLKLICDAMQKELFMKGGDDSSGGTTIPKDTMMTCSGSACGGMVALKLDSEYGAACGTIMTTYGGQKLGFSQGFSGP